MEVFKRNNVTTAGFTKLIPEKVLFITPLGWGYFTFSEFDSADAIGKVVSKCYEFEDVLYIGGIHYGNEIIQIAGVMKHHGLEWFVYDDIATEIYNYEEYIKYCTYLKKTPLDIFEYIAAKDDEVVLYEIPNSGTLN